MEHQTTQDDRFVDPLSHCILLKIVGFLVSSWVWVRNPCRCHALLNNYQLLSTPKNEYLTGKQLQIMLTCKMSSNMNHSKLQIWDKNCWAMDVATHIAIYCGKQQRCFFCRKSANIQVLIFCVEFRELSHLPRDLSQDEKKINFVTRWANAQNDIYFTQNGRSCHFEGK